MTTATYQTFSLFGKYVIAELRHLLSCKTRDRKKHPLHQQDRQTDR